MQENLILNRDGPISNSISVDSIYLNLLRIRVRSDFRILFINFNS